MPIWFTLIRIEFAAPVSIPFLSLSGVGDEHVVAHHLHLVADLLVSFTQPSQSSSLIPSSIERIGYLAHRPAI